MLIDTHTHLLDSRMRDNADDIVKRLHADGVEHIIEIGTDYEGSRTALDFAAAHENVYCTVGIHPMFAGSYSDEFETWASDHITRQTPLLEKGVASVGRLTGYLTNKILAIGECGLDYFHMDFSKDIQRETFVRQIKLADRLSLPLVVHSRDAFDDLFAILDSHRAHLKNGIILHCFAGGAQEVNRFAQFGAYFAFGGTITYKDASRAAEAIRAVPRDRLILETDCPYLAPVPFRGKINEPKYIKIVAEHVAALLDLTFDQVAKLTTENAKRVFRIALQ